jgi:hypothetical protein
MLFVCLFILFLKNDERIFHADKSATMEFGICRRIVVVGGGGFSLKKKCVGNKNVPSRVKGLLSIFHRELKNENIFCPPGFFLPV